MTHILVGQESLWNIKSGLRIGLVIKWQNW